jgi:hypothetical protein
MNALRAVSLLAATVSMGLVAGVFGLDTQTIMPGLGGPTTEPSSARSSPSTGDPQPVVHGWRLLRCLGSTVVAALAHIGQGGLPWIAAALACTWSRLSARS